jgi:predicted Zn-dependent protease with MMP-like domain
MAAILKQFLGTGGGQNDLKEILAENYKLLGTVLASQGGNKKNDISDEILKASVQKMLNPGNPLKEVMSAMESATQIKGMFSGESSSERDSEEGGEMKREPSRFDKLIDLAMDHLPDFLARFGGDETQAGAALKKENKMAGVMLHNPAARKAFYEALVAEHGQESADRWAKGLGYSPSQFHAQPQQPKVKRVDTTGAMVL